MYQKNVFFLFAQSTDQRQISAQKTSLLSFIFCKTWQESSTNCGELESNQSREWKMQNQKSILISMLSESAKLYNFWLAWFVAA